MIDQNPTPTMSPGEIVSNARRSLHELDNQIEMMRKERNRLNQAIKDFSAKRGILLRLASADIPRGRKPKAPAGE